LFAEQFLKLIAPTGLSGLIVPTGIVTDNSTKAYFEEVSSKERLASIISFENEEFIFRGVHHSFRFYLLTISGEKRRCNAMDAFYLRNLDQITDSRRFFVLSGQDIARFNPNTRTSPLFRSEQDCKLSEKIYLSFPVLDNEATPSATDCWKVSFRQGLFNMTSDSGLFMDHPDIDCLPLYEAKQIHHFDHRWASYNKDKSICDATLSEKQNHDFCVVPRYWVGK